MAGTMLDAAEALVSDALARQLRATVREGGSALPGAPGVVAGGVAPAAAGTMGEEAAPAQGVAADAPPLLPSRVDEPSPAAAAAPGPAIVGEETPAAPGWAGGSEASPAAVLTTAGEPPGPVVDRTEPGPIGSLPSAHGSPATPEPAPVPPLLADAVAVPAPARPAPGAAVEESRPGPDVPEEPVTIAAAPASGREDAPIPLGIALAHANETTRVSVSGLPAGARLSAGVAGPDGTWTLTAEEAAEVALIPAPDWSGSAVLDLRATSRDAAGRESEERLTLPVSVEAVADAPDAFAHDVVGTEDGAIPLDLHAALRDLDGSEALSVAILGVPAGATLSAGTRGADGAWTVPPGELRGLTMTPPHDFAGDLRLTLRATSTEATGDAALRDLPFTVRVTPVVDGATLSAAASGREDTAIPIGAEFGASPDGSESWDSTVVVRGVPSGATLSAGTPLGDGAWSVPTAELAAGRVAITPPADADAPIALTIEARISDHDGTGASRAVTTTFRVEVAAVADRPDATAADALGEEDSAIPLDLSAALRDLDGSEALSVAILGVPDGAILSAGSRGADGTWIVPADRLPDLALTPPPDFAGDIPLTMRVNATEATGDAAMREVPFTVHVAPVVDGADLTASAVGFEDSAIPIHAAFGAPPDPSESWEPTAIIRGVPDGATLNAGTDLGGGAWRVDTADLVAGRVAITPPADSDLPIPLRIEARITDRDGATAVRDVAANVTVFVQAVADAPVVAAQDAAGVEDRAIPLDLHAALTDLDRSETLHVAILGLPVGASLSAGERGPDGAWLVEPVDLPGLTLTPPPDFAGTMALTLRAVATESRGDSAMREVPFNVVVAAEVDGATLAATASGREDTAIPIHAAFGASPDASESWDAVVVLRGVPQGAALSGGRDLGGGAWEVDRARLEAGEVSVTPPRDSDAPFTLTLEARITDAEGGGASRAVTAQVTVAVAAVADAPDAVAQDAAGAEDTAIPLRLGAALRDLDGSEALSVAILGLPPGAALSAGARGADGAWTVAAADLPGLALTPPADWSGTLHLTLRATATEGTGNAATREVGFAVAVAPRTEAGASLVASGSGAEDRWIAIEAHFATPDADGSERLSDTTRIEGLPAGAALNAGTQVAPGTWTVPTADLLAGRVAVRPPADSDADLRLTITATLEDRAGSALDTRALVATAEVRVAAVADAPAVTVADSAGAEDTAIRLNLSAALTDRDGSETLTVAVLGVPAGATLSAGIRGADGVWTVPAASLPTLSLTPPRDFADDLRLTLRATATERDGGDAAVTETGFTVRVAPVVDGATLSVTASGREDTAIPILATFGTSPDASESWEATAVIRGVPSGATLSSGTNLGGGAWRVDTADLAAGRIGITPPANSDAAIPLTIEARITDRDGAGATRDVSAGVTVAVAGVADAPVATAANVAGAEDTAIRLNLSAALTDTDGSEALTVAILGVPTGATLSAGTRGSEGTWTVPAAALPTLSLTPPRDFAGDLNLTLRATSTEARGGSAAVTTAAFTVTVAPRADAAAIAVSGDGAEDSWIPVRGTIATTDADGSERLDATITVSDVPAGATLNAGTLVSPGVWSVPREVFAAGNLAIRPPVNSDADIALRIGVTTTDGADSATTTATATVVVRAVADAPTVQVADARGSEDTPIRLAGLGGALTDTDGSETLSFVLSGVPSTATLSAGTRNGDGTWTLTPAQLSAVSVTPPANFSGSMNLTLTAVATEARDGAAPARTSASFVVGVDPVADAGTISGSAIGNEDTAITVRPTFATPDADGSETWSATSRISGVPAGAVLTRGTEVSAGVWEVSTADLRGGLVAVRPAANSDADFSLTVSATLTDTGNGVSVSRVITGTHTVVVKAVADAPVVTASDVTGAEDTPIPLRLSAALTDTDGSEALTLVMTGVPAGATLSAGTRNADGTWTVLPADLPMLSVTPPRDFSGTMNLTLRATASDNDASTATTAASFAVRVDAVADAPGLRVGPAAGAEDSAIGLRVSGWTTDVDGSETLVGFRVMDVPQGATLRAGGVVLARQADGSFLVDAAAAPTLSVTPPVNSDGDFTLRIAAISAEPNGSRAESVAAMVPVQVDAVADAPVWVRVGATGAEDTAIPLDLAARLTDTDGSERLSYVVSGLPAGAVLSAGTYRGPGSWSLTVGEAANVTITPPRDFAGTIALTVSAVAQEGDGGSQAVSTVSFPLRVTAVVDTGAWGAGFGGNEDTAIALNLAPPLRDSDGSERLVGSVVVEGIPAGATLRLADGTVVAVTNGSAGIAADRIAGVTLTPPRDSDVAIPLTVRATVEDTGGVRATVVGTVVADPRGVADTPSLTVSDVRTTGHAGDGASEGWVSLPVAAAATDLDGSEAVHVWVRDVPTGFALSAGTPAGDGAWLLRAADLPGLQIRPPAGFTGDVPLRVTAVAVEREGDTAGRDARLTLTVEAPPGSSGGGGSSGTAASGLHAQVPALGVTGGTAEEDTAATLSIQVASRDSDGGQETLGVRIEGLPAGASLSAGIRDPERNAWVLRPDELAGLRVNPPANFSGDLSLRVTAIAVERNGDAATTEEPATLHFEAVADAASVRAAPAAGLEDRAVPLNLSVAPGDADGSETVVSVLLSGLSPGASIAPGPGIQDNGNGTWSVAPGAVGSVSLVPPANAHGTFGLTVTVVTREASSGDTETVSRGVTVAVSPVPDAPAAAAGDVAGREDQPIALNLSASLRDTDGSEALSVVLSGFPEGARLSAGVNNGDGTWTLTPSQLTGLTVTPPGNWSGIMALTMSAHAMERSTAEVATTSVPFRVSVAGAADAPLVDAATTAAGAEDTPIPVDIVARLTDTDGSETLSVIVTGVPAGASFSGGAVNPDGSWTIPGAALPGLTFTPPANYAGTLRLDFAATSREADGDSAAVRFSVSVTVDPVADAPHLSFTGITTNEDTAIRLPLAAVLVDADGSESIARYVVSGVPGGATLSAGTRGSDGAWTLTPTEAAIVTVTPPANYSGTITLSVTAVSREAANGAEAATTASLSVTVVPVADAPVLTAASVTGNEDTAIRLPLAATLTDADGSESIARYVVAGLPAGATLSVGTRGADGSWTLTEAQAANVAVTPPANYSGTMTLSVTAVSREAANGAEAATTAALSVTVVPVADAPVLTATSVTTDEDTAVRLPLAAGLTDTDGSESIARYVVSGLPAGAVLSAGTRGSDGAWTLSPADAATVAIMPPSNYSGTMALSVTAVSREAANGAEAATTASFSVTVVPVADAPVLTAASVTGNEDTAIRLPLAAALSDADGSESIARYVVSGLPSGAILSAGTRGNDGAWTLTPMEAATVTVTPPANHAGTMALSVTAVSREAANGSEATTTAVLSVTVLPVADSPVLAAADAVGTEDMAVSLSLAAALGDTDGSESFVALRVTGLPDGFALSAGTSLGGGAWSLTPAQLDGLRMTAPADWNGSVALTLTATAQDGASTATSSRAFTVTVAPVNDAPALSLAPAGHAAAGQATAAALGDATSSDVDSARMGGATIALSGGGTGEHLTFVGHALTTANGITTVGDTGITMTTGANGTVTLSGPASVATYERVLESLSIEAGDPTAGLGAGTRSIAVTLRDEAGAAAATQTVAITVAPSLLAGNGTGAALAGTAGHDTITGSAGSETMTGGAGADLFVLAMGGGHDHVDGGGGAWTDVIRVDGGQALGAGAWTLHLDSGTAAASADGHGFDLSQGATGHIAFADGGIAEFAGVERITW